MAVERKNPKASLRLSNSHNRTVCTYSGIRPDVATNAVKAFAEALEIFRGANFGFKYLLCSAELEESN